MKNRTQTVDCFPRQREGGITANSADEAGPHGSDDFNLEPPGKDQSAEPLTGAHRKGKKYARSSPASTDRHGLV